MAESKGKIEVITAQFSKEEKRQIRILAAHDGLSMRDWVRVEILKIITNEFNGRDGKVS